MDEHNEIISLLKEIQANQLSLHDDMVTTIDRLTKLEVVVNDLTKITGEPVAIDEHQLYQAARALVVETSKCSTSFLQRVLRIGYSRAALLVDTLEENGVVGPSSGGAPRPVLLEISDLEEIEGKEESDEQWQTYTGDHDDLYEEARKAVIEAGQSSVSYLQRKLRIGYSRAVFIQDLLEKKGVVGPQNGTKPREVVNNPPVV